jgi:hypothetical protein
MKIRSLIICLLIISRGLSQESLKINADGQKLKEYYVSLDVENLWIAAHHINWETGLPDMPEATKGIRTHCSAFVAAACERLNVYILRPPQHGQVLLSNAQAEWLHSRDAQQAGWQKLNDDDTLYTNAQRLANQGKIVVAICKNPDHSKPGHVALVMPSDRSTAILQEEGPEMIMAGTHNFNYIALIKAFKSHITSWPSHEIEFFVHELPAR